MTGLIFQAVSVCIDHHSIFNYTTLDGHSFVPSSFLLWKGDAFTADEGEDLYVPLGCTHSITCLSGYWKENGI